MDTTSTQFPSSQRALPSASLVTKAKCGEDDAKNKMCNLHFFKTIIINVNWRKSDKTDTFVKLINGEYLKWVSSNYFAGFGQLQQPKRPNCPTHLPPTL